MTEHSIERRFKQQLINEEKSNNTIKSYILHVKQFLQWFNESKGIEFKRLYRENILDYISYLKTVKQDKPATINAKISGLIKFNEFLIDSGIQRDTVISKKDNIKVQKQYASLAKVSVKDVEQFRQLILQNESRRNYAIVTLLAYAGLRISEALNLKINDFNLETKELIVKDGKGEKTRTVFMNQKVINAVRLYIDERKSSSDYLFVSKFGNKLDRTVINRMFAKYSKTITPHDLRHFFCSYLIENDFSVHEVANLAGHSNINTTLLYTNPSKQAMLNKMNRL